MGQTFFKLGDFIPFFIPFEGINMLIYAIICQITLLDKSLGMPEKIRVCEDFKKMIKVLFVCHGRIPAYYHETA